MARLQLSPDDQRLVEELFAKHVLQEARLDTDLSRTLIVTDFMNPSPHISLNVEVASARTMAVANGGCALHRITSDAKDDEQRDSVASRIRQTLHEKNVDQIALVVSVPSAGSHRSFVDTIDQLRSAQEFVNDTFGKKRQIHNFICVQFPDGREYTFQINTPEFSAWYNRYEQEVLGRDDRALEDDEEDVVERSGILDL